MQTADSPRGICPIVLHSRLGHLSLTGFACAFPLPKPPPAFRDPFSVTCLRPHPGQQSSPHLGVCTPPTPVCLPHLLSAKSGPQSCLSPLSALIHSGKPLFPALLIYNGKLVSFEEMVGRQNRLIIGQFEDCLDNDIGHF